MTASTLTKGAYRTGEYGIVTLPRITTPHARFGAIWAHFSGGNAFTAGAQSAPFFTDATADAGYPTFSADLCAAAYQSGSAGTAPNYGPACVNDGNADHVSAIGAAFTYLQGAGAKSAKFYGMAASMGTIGLLNYAKANPSNIGALVLFVPELDLNQAYINTQSTAGLAALVCTAYALSAPVTHAGCVLNSTATVADANSAATWVGWYVSGANVTPGTTILSQTTGVGFVMSAPATGSATESLLLCPPLGSTILNASSPQVYGASAFAGIPILLCPSDNDPICSNTTAATAWAAGQSNISVVSQGSIGHTLPAGTNPQTIVGFFNAHGGQS